MSTPQGPSEPRGSTRGDRSGSFWTSVAQVAGRRGGIVAIIAVLLTVGLGFGITRLEFSTSQDNYLNSGSQVAKDNIAYQSLFGGQAMLANFKIDDGKQLKDLFTPHNVAEFDALAKELESDPRIVAVVTPKTALEFTHNLVTSPDGNPIDSPAGKMLLGARERDTDPTSQAKRLEDSITTLGRINQIPPAQHTFSDQAWVDFLLHDNAGDVRRSLLPFFPNDENAQMVVRLAGNASIDDEGAASELVEEAMAKRQFDNATVTTTGAPVLLRDINDYLRGGFLTLGAIAAAFMVALLLVAFAVRWRLLPLGVVVVGQVWAFGLAGYLGVPLNIVTISGLPVLLGVGIDFAVQLHSRVEEEAQLAHDRHPVAEALHRLMPALALATVAAVVAFLALEFSAVPMIRDFGTLLALGLPVIVLATVLLTSASLAWREQRRPTPPKDYTRGPLGRTTVLLGSLPRVAAIPLVVAAVAVFAGGVLVEGRLTVQTDPQKWVSQDSQVIKDLNRLRDNTGTTSELGVFVQSDDVFDDRTVGFVDEFARAQLAKYPDDLNTASSLVTTVSFLLDVPDAQVVPPTGEDVRAAYEVAPEAIKRSTVNLGAAGGNAGAFNLIFQTGPRTLEQRAVVVKDIRATVDPPEGVRATPSGLAVVGTGLLDNIEKNRVELTYYALLGVFVVLFVRYRGPVKALLSMVPVLIAVGLTSLIAWVSGLELSPLTALGGPLIIALCTEFTSLIVARHLEERARGLAPRAAVDEAAARTGRAFLVSAAAAVVGILVLAVSPLPLLRDFGLLVALNVAVALLSALVVLPPLLVWMDERGWVHRPRGGAPVPPRQPSGDEAVATALPTTPTADSA
ncbi:MMPL family transporter [Frankia sp. CNm7]|uniref:MMPL family transporter n=1 Tax=Frankia nepalensis TaxID=1836974 RepID=A0A937UT54_9ACTN|nr:MMPL family transporter [Frankia nepalensis]MBL7497530.1 MMPL family transporter [Frankia nepalensis]MBL7510204.1 MMPL family transporter [Frankia nepalensis]MBL7524441.1 MMPL family transporter [Frankia nepalensis]MBL7630915.1 MMPL family transporter [Frankia nepalensis]